MIAILKWFEEHEGKCRLRRVRISTRILGVEVLPRRANIFPFFLFISCSECELILNYNNFGLYYSDGTAPEATRDIDSSWMELGEANDKPLRSAAMKPLFWKRRAFHKSKSVSSQLEAS